MTLDAVVPCDDLDEAMAFLTKRLGFRIDAIAPADDPAVAQLSGHGLTLALRRGDSDALELLANPTLTVPELREELVVTQPADDAWVEGRAGMRYRDLIPGRLGGRFIASHIEIPGGGPVPDYVHFHDVRFQLIFCAAGWVELVYEDQGPPFVLRAGDCVLQPPLIRHRVLNASPGLEVVEIGCPAQHLTRAEHEMELPTAQLRPDRDFGGQRFVRHVAADAVWQPWTSPGWEHRDTGIAAATDGLAGVRVVRPVTATTTGPRRHHGELLQYVVLHGTLELEVTGQRTALGRMASVAIPGGLDYELGSAGADLELLEVTLPA